jgi:tyrosyl-tRNA synthetase
VAAIIEGLSAGSLDPMATKKRLAHTIVTEFHGEDAARTAEEHFERTVQRRETPDEIPTFQVADGQALIDVILGASLAPSKREARRLFEQGAVSVDGEAVDVATVARAGTVVQVGKRRYVRLV